MADTCFFIDLMLGDVGAREVEEEVGRENICSSSICYWELWRGTSLQSSTKVRQPVLELIDQYEWLPFDIAVCLAAGELQRSLKGSGTPLGQADHLIASTALLHCEGIITEDRTLDHIEDLKIKRYR